MVVETVEAEAASVALAETETAVEVEVAEVVASEEIKAVAEEIDAIAASAMKKAVSEVQEEAVEEMTRHRHLQAVSQRVQVVVDTKLFIAALTKVQNIKMLSIDKKAFLLNKIEQDLIQVEKDIHQLKEDTKPIAPENAIGRVSRMDAINNKSVAEETLRQNIDKQKRLQAAKERIKDIDFGICFKCNEPIPFERLTILPYTRTCMKCNN